MTLTVEIDGVDLRSIDGLHFGRITRSYGERGCQSASLPFYLPPGIAHAALRRGKMLEAVDSAGVDWAGIVTEINPGEGVIRARGYGAEANGFPALDGSGNATSNPRTACTNAIADGWGVASVDSSIPNANYTATVDGVNTTAALLDAQADENGTYWTVFEDRVVRMGAAPTAPVWQIPPGIVDLGTADDDYVSALKVRYRSGASTYATVNVVDTVAAGLFGKRWDTVDTTPLGIITSGRATTIGNGLLTKGRSRMGWSQGFEVSKFSLLTMGMKEADLSLVRSLQMVRINGIDDDRQALFGLPYLDCLIGEATWTDGEPTISLSPLGVVAQSNDEVIAKLAAEKAA